jgi:primosomal protein N' (replication factor Y) (superfamily II helicase)
VPLVLHVWLPLPLPGLDYLAPHDAPPDAPGTRPRAFGDAGADADPGGDGADGLVGRRLAVPWQGGLRVGWVGAVRPARPAETLDLRPAIAWVGGRERLAGPARTMLAAQAARCAVPIGVSVAAGGPPGLRGPWRHEVRRDAATPPELLGATGTVALAADAWHDADGLDPVLLDDWRRHGLVHERVMAVEPRERRLVVLRPADADLAGASREAQRIALAWLVAEGSSDSAAALARDAGVAAGAARALVTKGYAGYAELPPPPRAAPWVTPAAAPPFDAAEPRGGEVPGAAGEADADAAGGLAAADRLLLTGGDASGRWSAALRWLRPATASGGQALVLVPEQTVAETLARALAQVVPTLRWGSDLDDAARAALAEELAAGVSAAVVGTYPALTLDLPRLRRVLVWDAASGSYKQLAGPRSVARRDALELAAAAGAAWALVDPLATAELRASGASTVVSLPRIAPRTALLDLRSEPGWPLSAQLVRLLRQVAERGRQAVLLVARRGYAAALGCRTCGELVMCPNCDLPLRWHQRVGRLRCHRCGVETAAPTACPACTAPALAPRPGAGTEWVAEAVRGVLPGTPVWSWDRDRRDDLGPLQGGQSGVLVGTQAVLRLPPLPQLSLLALTAGDALHDHEDVRAEESALRTLLTLADLAPPGRRPLLVAQVHRTEHDVWQTWTDPDLDGAVVGFLERVAGRRRLHGYPPARCWARVQLTHRDARTVAEAAQALAGRLRLAGVPAGDVLGPAPAPLARVRGRYAFHVFVRADDEAELAARVAGVDLRPGGGVQVRLDVDPYDVETWLD